MRRAGWAVIAAWGAGAVALACSSFSGDDSAPSNDGGADSQPASESGSSNDASSSADALKTGELVHDTFESPGMACDWITNKVSAVKADGDGGRVCRVCTQTDQSASLYRDIPVTAQGTYTLSGNVHNLSAADIDTRIVGYYADGGTDITGSQTGPLKDTSRLMQATFAARQPMSKVQISYRFDRKRDGCVEIDDVVLEHAPP